MTTATKIEGKLVLVIDGEIEAGTMYESLQDVEAALAAKVQEDDTFNLDEVEISILNVVGVMESGVHFYLDIEQEDPFVHGDEELEELECKYYVEDINRTYTDIEDIREDFIRLIRDRDYTAEEVKEFSIVRTVDTLIEFDDIEEGAPTVEIKLKKAGADIDDQFGSAFYNASLLNVADIVQKEMMKQLDEQRKVLVNVERDVNSMTFEEMANEMAILHSRMQALRTGMLMQREENETPLT